MKWAVKEITLGDMVRVPMETAYHYGVCTGEDRIIEFGEAIFGSPVPPDKVTVIATDIKGFIGKARFAEVAELDRKEKKARRSVADTVSYAESRLGEGGYNLLTNNCEHFANECLFGKHQSTHIDVFREQIEAMLPRIDIYIAKTDDLENAVKVRKLPGFVRKELRRKAADPQKAAEKRAAYALLYTAVKEIYGKEPEPKQFLREELGKPKRRDFCFSVSHAGSVVAVAVSKAEVGVDVQADGESDGLFESIATDAERVENKNLPPRLLWTKKEAIYKFLDTKKTFVPSKTDTKAYKTVSKMIETDDGSFYLSVSAKTLTNTRFSVLSEGVLLRDAVSCSAQEPF